jgi:hypothetical protein
VRILHFLIIAAVFSLPNVLFFGEKKNCLQSFFPPDMGDYRSRKMLKNAYLDAKIGFDTAEILLAADFA